MRLTIATIVTIVISGFACSEGGRVASDADSRVDVDQIGEAQPIEAAVQARCAVPESAPVRFPFPRPGSSEDSLLAQIAGLYNAWGNTRADAAARHGPPLHTETVATPNRHLPIVDSTTVFTYADRELAFWWSSSQQREILFSTRVWGDVELPGGIRVNQSELVSVVDLVGPPASEFVAADTTACSYNLDWGAAEDYVTFGFVRGILRWVHWLPYFD